MWFLWGWGPLLNFDEVVGALWRMVDLLGISKRKITLSTSGIVPKIPLLPRKGPEINLAISLNAATDDVRNRIMPVNKRYPIQSLINACRKYPLQPTRRITFEYVMIDGVNDSSEDAHRLVRLLSAIKCKVVDRFDAIIRGETADLGVDPARVAGLESFQELVLNLQEDRGFI